MGEAEVGREPREVSLTAGDPLRGERHRSRSGGADRLAGHRPELAREVEGELRTAAATASSRHGAVGSAASNARTASRDVPAAGAADAVARTSAATSASSSSAPSSAASGSGAAAQRAVNSAARRCVAGRSGAAARAGADRLLRASRRRTRAPCRRRRARPGG